MVRLDVPTLECDRCEFVTQNLTTMSQFMTLSHGHVSGNDEWDLCPECSIAFHKFIGESFEV